MNFEEVSKKESPRSDKVDSAYFSDYNDYNVAEYERNYEDLYINTMLDNAYFSDYNDYNVAEYERNYEDLYLDNDNYEFIGESEKEGLKKEAEKNTNSETNIRIAKYFVDREKHFYRTTKGEIFESINNLSQQGFSVFEIVKSLKLAGYKNEDIETVIKDKFPFMIRDERSYFRILVYLDLGVGEVADRMAKFMKENSPGDEECIFRLVSMLKNSGYFEEVKAQDIIQPLLDNHVFNDESGFLNCFEYEQACEGVVKALVANEYTAKELKDLQFFIKDKEGKPSETYNKDCMRQIFEISPETGKVKPLTKTWEDIYTGVVYGFSKQILENFYKKEVVNDLDWHPWERKR